MSDPDIDQAKAKVRAQFGAAGDAYVTSPGHASGDDLARLVEILAPRPTDRALDIATGGGHVARALAPMVAEVVASDLTPEMLAQAERFFRDSELDNVSTALADAEALPFPDAAFDIVTCRIAPHHFPHPDRFVSETARVLKPGGHFGLIDSTVPDGELGARFNRFEAARDPSHVRSLTVLEWQGLIGAAGLVLLTTEAFAKRNVFTAWCDRARVPVADRPSIAAVLLEGGPDAVSAFHLELEGERLIAVTDVKTLFLAKRPAGNHT